MTRYKEITIPNTEHHVIYSNIVKDQFKLYVLLPSGYYETTKDYPVVYLLDANVYFSIVAGTVKLLQFGEEIPDVIIIGVGYPEDSNHLYLRNRDYLPTSTVDHDNSGGANDFLNFIIEELKPYVEGKFRVNADKTILAGDSYSGLFSLYTLFNRPNSFSGYIVGSPSLYWDDSITFTYEREFASSHDDLKTKIFLSVGALEAVFEPEFAAMVDNVEKLADVLRGRNYPSLELVTHIFENETHLSVIPATMSRGLRELFRLMR
ncbi:alpha/beta hydrolase-fold protein [Mycoplasmatota bacterium WC44]